MDETLDSTEDYSDVSGIVISGLSEMILVETR